MEIKNRDVKFKSIPQPINVFDYCAYTHLPGGCKRVGKCYKIHSAEVKGKINWPCRAYLTIKGCSYGNNCVYLHTPKKQVPCKFKDNCKHLTNGKCLYKHDSKWTTVQKPSLSKLAEYEKQIEENKKVIQDLKQQLEHFREQKIERKKREEKSTNMISVEVDKLFSELCPTPSTPSTPIKEKKEKGKKILQFQTIPPYMRSLLKSSNYVYEDLLTLDHETISGGDWGEINISDYITLEEKWKGKDLVHYICDMITNSKCSEAIIIGFVQTVVNVIHTQLMKTCSADDESSLEEFLQPLRDASLNRGFSYFGALMSLVAVFNGFTDGDEAFEVLFNRANWNQEDSPYVLNS